MVYSKQIKTMDNLNNVSYAYEPMDIDLSAHSNNAMDISFNSSTSANDIANWEADNTRVQPAEPAQVETTIPPVPPSNKTHQSTSMKKLHINMHKETIPHTITKIKIFCTVLTLLLSVATYQILNIQCSDDINLDELQQSLSSKLYGQSQAIGSLIEALNVRDKSKILFFYGGTGVGKTFTASLLLEHIGYYSNVYHYTMPSFMDTFTTDFMIGLSVCKKTIIIIDDLSTKDMNVKTHIEDVITKSQNLEKDITVVLIYNCDNAAKDFERQCDEYFPSKLLHNFKYIDAFKKLIKFEQLKEEHLRKCIKTELNIRRISNIEYEKILKNFNVSQDGCKGVYTKMKFLEIS